MFLDEYTNVCNAAKGKVKFLEQNPVGYMVASVIAGMFIAFGGFVAFYLGSFFSAAGSPATKGVQGFAFAAALSLVVMAGAELFTGNNMVLGAAAFDKADNQE